MKCVIISLWFWLRIKIFKKLSIKSIKSWSQSIKSWRNYRVKVTGFEEAVSDGVVLRSSCFWDNVLIQLSVRFLAAMSKSWIISFVNILVQKEKVVIKEDEQFIRRFVSSISPEKSRQSDWIILNFRFDTSLWSVLDLIFFWIWLSVLSLTFCYFSVIWIGVILIWILPKSLPIVVSIVLSTTTIVIYLNLIWIKPW